VSNTRTVEQKKALYGGIVERLGKNPGLRGTPGPAYGD
jgi:hypothetical protein